jgi:hypothetical protein
VARRPLERERIYLDGGRRTTQLMRDSLGGCTDKMRTLALLILASACAAGTLTPIPTPPGDAERDLLGCYRFVCVGQEPGAPFSWGSYWAPAEIIMRFDSTPAWVRFGITVSRTARFLEGMPPDLQRAVVGWRRQADTLNVHQYAGVEGQGILMTLTVRGDSLLGEAHWSWTTMAGMGDRKTGPVIGARHSCT